MRVCELCAHHTHVRSGGTGQATRNIQTGEHGELEHSRTNDYSAIHLPPPIVGRLLYPSRDLSMSGQPQASEAT